MFARESVDLSDRRGLYLLESSRLWVLGFLKESIKCIFLTLAGGKKSIAHVYGCQPGKEMIKSYMDLHARQGPSEYIRGITYIFFMVIFLFKTSFCARIILLLLSNTDQVSILHKICK